MKKIEAIIRRTKFEEVKEALLAADIEWFSYYEVRGVGKTREGRIYRGVVYDTSSIERILISIVVREKNVEKTVQAIMKAAYTGEIGDGANTCNIAIVLHSHKQASTRMIGKCRNASRYFSGVRNGKFKILHLMLALFN